MEFQTAGGKITAQNPNNIQINETVIAYMKTLDADKAAQFIDHYLYTSGLYAAITTIIDNGGMPQ